MSLNQYLHNYCRLRHKDLVSSVLRCHRFMANSEIVGASGTGNDGRNEVLLKELIHAKNNQGQTLLSMIALQGEEGSAIFASGLEV